jgi:signal transduction histidine kinase
MAYVYPALFSIRHGYLRHHATRLLKKYSGDFPFYLCVFVVYAAAGLFSSYMYHIAGTGPAVILAPQGIALAAALIFGYSVIPVTALATFFVALFAGNPLILALFAFGANIAQPALTLSILDKFKVNRQLDTTWDFYIYIAVVFVSSTVVPTVNVLGREFYNSSALEPVNSLIWSNLLIAGLVSVLIVTPFLVRMKRPLRRFTKYEWLENIIAVAVLMVPTVILTYTPATAIMGLNLLIPFCVALMWVALRGGTFFVTMAMFAVSALAISGRILGNPANPQGLDLASQIVNAQTSLIVFALIFYFIAALEENRRAANLKLQTYAKELEKDIAEKDSAAAAKNEFIAVLGHELRNPLAPIVSAVEILRLPNLSPQKNSEMVEIIGHQANQLTSLLRDLLDVSRIARGNIHLSVRQVDMQKKVAHATAAVKPKLQVACHTVSVSVPKEPVYITGDPVRIEQILVNLLDNATKYTEPGGTIRISLSTDDMYVKVSVLDSGIGIAPEMHEKIFDPFVQTKNSKGMSNGGLGIGLMLSRNLARLHGGDLTVTSDGADHGSEFTLSLPRKTSAAAVVSYARGIRNSMILG